MFRAALTSRSCMAKRGLDDPDLVLIDVWTYGAHLIAPEYAQRRIGWCDVWVRDAPDSNPYAHPVSGLKLVVDLNTMGSAAAAPGRPLSCAATNGHRTASGGWRSGRGVHFRR